MSRGALQGNGVFQWNEFSSKYSGVLDRRNSDFSQKKCGLFVEIGLFVSRRFFRRTIIFLGTKKNYACFRELSKKFCGCLAKVFRQSCQNGKLYRNFRDVCRNWILRVQTFFSCGGIFFEKEKIVYQFSIV